MRSRRAYYEGAFVNGAVLASPLPSTVLASSARPSPRSRERTDGRVPYGRSIVLTGRGLTLNVRAHTTSSLPRTRWRGRCGRSPIRRKKLADAYAEAKATDLPPDWNIDFTSALTRLIAATCVGLMAEPAESNPG